LQEKEVPKQEVKQKMKSSASRKQYKITIFATMSKKELNAFITILTGDAQLNGLSAKVNKTDV